MSHKIARCSILIFCFSAIVSGQIELETKGILKGLVVNAVTREPLPSANITLAGTVLGTTSDTNGMFTIGNIPTGVYIVRVSLIGFVTSVTGDVVLTSNKPANLTIQLVSSDINLDDVSVIADYFQKTPDANVSTQYQSYEEIRQLPGGFEDVVRAVSILPGVAQVQAGRNDLIVRGGAPSENLFLIDNLEIPNINHFGTQGASGGPLSFINLDFVQGTTFSSGGFGVRYGDKLSSVLSIDLRDGRTDRLGGKATISASQFGLNLEGPVRGNGSFIFSARRSYLDVIFKAAGFSFVPEYWDVFGKGDYLLSQNDKLSVLGIVALDRTKFFNETPDKRYDNSRILGNSQDQFVGGASWQHLFRSGYIRTSGGFRSVEYSYIQQDSLEQAIFSNESRESETYLSSGLVKELSKHTELSAGVQARIMNARADLSVNTFTSSFGDTFRLQQSGEVSSSKGAAFVQLSQKLAPLTMTIGGRVDYYTLIRNGVQFSPRFSSSLALDAATSVTFSAGRYVQAPSAIWILGNRENKDLTPIRANQLVLGVERTLREDTKVSIEGYVKSYNQYPVSKDRPYLIMANTGAGFGGTEEGFASFGFDTLISSGTGEAHGIELFLQKKFSEIPSYGTLSLSYNETRFTPLDGIIRPGSFDQRWIFNIGGGYVFSEQWEVSSKFRLVTGRPYTPFEPDGTQSAGRYNSMRVGTNHSLDVRVDRRWLFETWTLTAYIDIQNIYNKKPVDVPRYDKRTRSIRTNDSIGILPTIGVSAEF